MADPHHLELVQQGTAAVNIWRGEHTDTPLDLSEASLSKVNLAKADLSNADLSGANLILADLSEADLRNADLTKTDLVKAKLCKANLSGALLKETNLVLADLSEADLRMARLTGTNLRQANLSGCSIYGIAVWDVLLDGAEQSNLTIIPPDNSIFTTDDIQYAQFIYSLLQNRNTKTFIDVTTSRMVLILGRFTPEHKRILDAVKKELYKYRYVPILFDFEKPANQNLTGTVITLAHLSRFIIADITEPISVTYELATIVPRLMTVPVQPLLAEAKKTSVMLSDLSSYNWFLKEYIYKDLDDLQLYFKEYVIDPAEQKAKDLASRW